MVKHLEIGKVPVRPMNVANPAPRRVDRLLWLGMGVTAAVLILAALLATMKMRASLGKPLPVYGTVADFALTNQNGQAVSLAQLQGKVWVADIIFTRCAGPCLGMTRQMKSLQSALASDRRCQLVTLTTDADFDTPPVMKAYAERFGADPERWLFLTGPRRELAKLATDSLKLSALEKKPDERQSPEDLFIHSTIFVVVDEQGQLRGIFETTGDGIEPPQVQSEILAAVKRLERER